MRSTVDNDCPLSFGTKKTKYIMADSNILLSSLLDNAEYSLRLRHSNVGLHRRKSEDRRKAGEVFIW